MEVTQEMQRQIESQAGLPVLRRQALDQCMHTLRQSAVNKLVQGMTSDIEVLRLTVE
jgi:type II secretory ATPase GspE/PulE/Tfp pilus assembly ATPase PilB-like protein